jgi:hypothetical protein
LARVEAKRDCLEYYTPAHGKYANPATLFDENSYLINKQK